MRVTLVNWSTSEIIEIECLNWEIEKYQFFFYSDVDGKIKRKCFGTRNWDIRDIEYEVL